MHYSNSFQRPGYSFQQGRAIKEMGSPHKIDYGAGMRSSGQSDFSLLNGRQKSRIGVFGSRSPKNRSRRDGVSLLNQFQHKEIAQSKKMGNDRFGAYRGSPGSENSGYYSGSSVEDSMARKPLADVPLNTPAFDRSENQFIHQKHKKLASGIQNEFNREGSQLGQAQQFSPGKNQLHGLDRQGNGSNLGGCLNQISELLNNQGSIPLDVRSLDELEKRIIQSKNDHERYLEVLENLRDLNRLEVRNQLPDTFNAQSVEPGSHLRANRPEINAFLSKQSQNFKKGLKKTSNDYFRENLQLYNKYAGASGSEYTQQTSQRETSPNSLNGVSGVREGKVRHQSLDGEHHLDLVEDVLTTDRHQVMNRLEYLENWIINQSNQKLEDLHRKPKRSRKRNSKKRRHRKGSRSRSKYAKIDKMGKNKNLEHLGNDYNRGDSRADLGGYGGSLHGSSDYSPSSGSRGYDQPLDSNGGIFESKTQNHSTQQSQEYDYIKQGTFLTNNSLIYHNSDDLTYSTPPMAPSQNLTEMSTHPPEGGYGDELQDHNQADMRKQHKASKIGAQNHESLHHRPKRRRSSSRRREASNKHSRKRRRSKKRRSRSRNKQKQEIDNPGNNKAPAFIDDIFNKRRKTMKKEISSGYSSSEQSNNQAGTAGLTKQRSRQQMLKTAAGAQVRLHEPSIPSDIDQNELQEKPVSLLNSLNSEERENEVIGLDNNFHQNNENRVALAGHRGAGVGASRQETLPEPTQNPQRSSNKKWQNTFTNSSKKHKFLLESGKLASSSVSSFRIDRVKVKGMESFINAQNGKTCFQEFERETFQLTAVDEDQAVAEYAGEGFESNVEERIEKYEYNEDPGSEEGFEGERSGSGMGRGHRQEALEQGYESEQSAGTRMGGGVVEGVGGLGGSGGDYNPDILDTYDMMTSIQKMAKEFARNEGKKNKKRRERRSRSRGVHQKKGTKLRNERSHHEAKASKQSQKRTRKASSTLNRQKTKGRGSSKEEGGLMSSSCSDSQHPSQAGQIKPKPGSRDTENNKRTRRKGSAQPPARKIPSVSSEQFTESQDQLPVPIASKLEQQARDLMLRSASIQEEQILRYLKTATMDSNGQTPLLPSQQLPVVLNHLQQRTSQSSNQAQKANNNNSNSSSNNDQSSIGYQNGVIQITGLEAMTIDNKQQHEILGSIENLSSINKLHQTHSQGPSRYQSNTIGITGAGMVSGKAEGDMILANLTNSAGGMSSAKNYHNQQPQLVQCLPGVNGPVYQAVTAAQMQQIQMSQANVVNFGEIGQQRALGHQKLKGVGNGAGGRNQHPGAILEIQNGDLSLNPSQKGDQLNQSKKLRKDSAGEESRLSADAIKSSAVNQIQRIEERLNSLIDLVESTNPVNTMSSMEPINNNKTVSSKGLQVVGVGAQSHSMMGINPIQNRSKFVDQGVGNHSQMPQVDMSQNLVNGVPRQPILPKRRISLQSSMTQTEDDEMGSRTQQKQSNKVEKRDKSCGRRSPKKVRKDKSCGRRSPKKVRKDKSCGRRSPKRTRKDKSCGRRSPKKPKRDQSIGVKIQSPRVPQINIAVQAEQPDPTPTVQQVNEVTQTSLEQRFQLQLEDYKKQVQSLKNQLSDANQALKSQQNQLREEQNTRKLLENQRFSRASRGSLSSKEGSRDREAECRLSGNISFGRKPSACPSLDQYNNQIAQMQQLNQSGFNQSQISFAKRPAQSIIAEFEGSLDEVVSLQDGSRKLLPGNKEASDDSYRSTDDEHLLRYHYPVDSSVKDSSCLGGAVGPVLVDIKQNGPPGAAEFDGEVKEVYEDLTESSCSNLSDDFSSYSDVTKSGVMNAGAAGYRFQETGRQGGEAGQSCSTPYSSKDASFQPEQGNFNKRSISEEEIVAVDEVRGTGMGSGLGDQNGVQIGLGGLTEQQHYSLSSMKFEDAGDVERAELTTPNQHTLLSFSESQSNLQNQNLGSAFSAQSHSKHRGSLSTPNQQGEELGKSMLAENCQKGLKSETTPKTTKNENKGIFGGHYGFFTEEKCIGSTLKGYESKLPVVETSRSILLKKSGGSSQINRSHRSPEEQLKGLGINAKSSIGCGLQAQRSGNRDFQLNTSKTVKSIILGSPGNSMRLKNSGRDVREPQTSVIVSVVDQKDGNKGKAEMDKNEKKRQSGDQNEVLKHQNDHRNPNHAAGMPKHQNQPNLQNEHSGDFGLSFGKKSSSGGQLSLPKSSNEALDGQMIDEKIEIFLTNSSQMQDQRTGSSIQLPENQLITAKSDVIQSKNQLGLIKGSFLNTAQTFVEMVRNQSKDPQKQTKLARKAAYDAKKSFFWISENSSNQSNSEFLQNKSNYGGHSSITDAQGAYIDENNTVLTYSDQQDKKSSLGETEHINNTFGLKPTSAVSNHVQEPKKYTQEMSKSTQNLEKPKNSQILGKSQNIELKKLRNQRFDPGCSTTTSLIQIRASPKKPKNSKQPFFQVNLNALHTLTDYEKTFVTVSEDYQISKISDNEVYKNMTQGGSLGHNSLKNSSQMLQNMHSNVTIHRKESQSYQSSTQVTKKFVSKISRRVDSGKQRTDLREVKGLKGMKKSFERALKPAGKKFGYFVEEEVGDESKETSEDVEMETGDEPKNELEEAQGGSLDASGEQAELNLELIAHFKTTPELSSSKNPKKGDFDPEEKEGLDTSVKSDQLLNHKKKMNLMQVCEANMETILTKTKEKQLIQAQYQ